MKNMSMLQKSLVAGILIIIVVLVIVLSNKRGQPQATENAQGDPLSEQASDTAGQSSPRKTAIAPTKPVAQKTPKAVILDLSTEFARTHERALSEALAKPADFNQHYVVASWSCGNKCVTHAIVDKLTGRSYLAPAADLSGSTPSPEFVPYTLSSNIFKVVARDSIESYEFRNGQFTLINSEQI